jgi:uncharacterized protein (DUF362 family)
MRTKPFSRRSFLQQSLTLVVGAPVALRLAPAAFGSSGGSDAPAKGVVSARRARARVAIAGCRTYGAEVRAAMEKCFDLLGGIGSLVKNKTVAVKLNLTGTTFAPFLGRPVGETYMTHYATAMALGAALFSHGAKRVRFVESTASKDTLEVTLAGGGWDMRALEALGKVEFENTRNLGKGKQYAHFAVPNGGYMFSSFEMNHAYAETDVLVSLAKLKNHLTAGVTLSMKNLFGLPPNTLYGSQTGEDAIGVRVPLHNPKGQEKIHLLGLKEGITSADPGWRVPRVTVDICAARPIDLAIIDGITAMNGGEGPWCAESVKLAPTTPGVIIAGLNPVSTDAVATAVMGYKDPLGQGVKPFQSCDNHLLLAERAGLGTADLGQIEVRGLALEKARYYYG